MVDVRARMKRRVTGLLGGPRTRPRLSEETKARLAVTTLWVLVVAAGLGGLYGWVRPAAAPRAEEPRVGSPSSTVSEAWAAAGFGARAVAAYLAPGDDRSGEGGFGFFLGDPAAETATAETGAVAVAAVDVDHVGEGYWAVTVAAGEPGREEFWRVGVANSEGRLVATGLPTPVAAPPVGEQPEMAVTARETPPTDDPVVETVTGWVAAYACGQGDVSRWLAPEVRLTPVTPPLCQEARLDRWGTRQDDDGRLVVVTDVALDPGPSERRVTFALAMTRRDDRWEISELLAAPPLSEEETDQ